jgi:hypothetical protein
MEAYDPVRNLRFWPLESMARFGQNPFGENIWRIVHAPSRRSLVHGEGDKPRWLPTYPQAGDAWVLEKWLSAYDFTRCTPETWNMSMTLLGPYPSRGEYELAHIFNPAPLGEIEKIITLIEAGGRYSANENKNALKDELDKEKKDKQNYWHARLMDRMHAFGTAPMVGFGGGRGTKTKDIRLTAEEANLPTKPGHMSARPTKQKYDVSELIEA